MANKYTGSNTGKSGLNVKKTSGTPDVNGVTEIQLDSNLTLTNNGSGSVTIQSSGGGGGGSPGGSDTQLQYNDSGTAFGGISGATTDGTAVTVSSNNLITTSPKVVTGLTDEDGNSTIKTPPCGGTGANDITVSNQQAGSSPTIAATGSDTNLNLGLIPKGSGEIVVGSGSASGKITTSGAQDLVLDTNLGTDSGSITITEGVNGDITLDPDGTGAVDIIGNLTTTTSVAAGTTVSAGSSVSATTTVTAGSTVTGGTGVIATTGGVLASAGDLEATLGNLKITAGTIEAAAAASAQIGGTLVNAASNLPDPEIFQTAFIGGTTPLTTVGGVPVDAYTIGGGDIDPTLPANAGFTASYIPIGGGVGTPASISISLGGGDAVLGGGTVGSAFTVAQYEPFTVYLIGPIDLGAGPINLFAVYGNVTVV